MRQSMSQRVRYDLVTKQQQQLVPVFPGGSVAKNPPSKAGDSGSSPESGGSLEKKRQPTPVILDWRIQRTGELGEATVIPV